MFAGGSSPLARGLRLSSRERLPEVVDHPRSRGVYWQLVMVWSGGDWKVRAPSNDSWGEQIEESTDGFSAWTVK